MFFEDDEYYINVASHEDFTRDDIIVEYQPGPNVTHFSYTVLKNGEEIETVDIEDNSLIRIPLQETGQYTILFSNTRENGDIEEFKTGIYNIDKEAPKLEFSKDSFQIEAGSNYNLLKGVKATDAQSGNLTSQIVTDADKIDFTTLGEKNVTFKVTDEAGNTTVQTVTFEVVENRREDLFFKQCAIVGVICVIVLLILRYYRSILLEKRIGKYALEPKGRTISIFDRLVFIKDSLVDFLAKKLRKFNWIVYYSRQYEKYQVAFRQPSSVHIVAQKVWMSIIFLVVSIFASTLRFEVLSFVEMLLAFVLGFVLVDIIYAIRYHFYRNNVENDLLQAIIVMNNAFKSGHSIPQAIELVAEELDGDIHEEFARMRKELAMGLSVEDVFKRFSNRVGIDEVNYLSSSLSVLNNTGGNIIKVFASIEKTLMNKKKMRLEMKALTSSAKLVSYVLMILPALFILGVSFVSPDYFLPLVDNVLGWMLLIVIILVYLLYICIIRRIMKVRM